VDNDDVTSQSTHTFRDTEIEEVEANNLMKIQSIASIINDPKSDSFYKQVKYFINKIKSLDYKPLTEA
jgi:hypothetical protein